MPKIFSKMNKCVIFVVYLCCGLNGKQSVTSFLVVRIINMYDFMYVNRSRGSE